MNVSFSFFLVVKGLNRPGDILTKPDENRVLGKVAFAR